MEYIDWLKKEIGKLKTISAELKTEFGAIDREYLTLLFEDSKEPWGFVVRNQPGNQAPGNLDKKTERPLSDKQLAIIQKHLTGKNGPQVAEMISALNKSLDRLSVHEASEIIDTIFKGGS